MVGEGGEEEATIKAGGGVGGGEGVASIEQVVLGVGESELAGEGEGLVGGLADGERGEGEVQGGGQGDTVLVNDEAGEGERGKGFEMETILGDTQGEGAGEGRAGEGEGVEERLGPGEGQGVEIEAGDLPGVVKGETGVEVEAEGAAEGGGEDGMVGFEGGGEALEFEELAVTEKGKIGLELERAERGEARVELAELIDSEGEAGGETGGVGLLDGLGEGAFAGKGEGREGEAQGEGGEVSVAKGEVPLAEDGVGLGREGGGGSEEEMAVGGGELKAGLFTAVGLGGEFGRGAETGVLVESRTATVGINHEGKAGKLGGIGKGGGKGGGEGDFLDVGIRGGASDQSEGGGGVAAGFEVRGLKREGDFSRKIALQVKFPREFGGAEGDGMGEFQKGEQAAERFGWPVLGGGGELGGVEGEGPVGGGELSEVKAAPDGIKEREFELGGRELKCEAGLAQV